MITRCPSLMPLSGPTSPNTTPHRRPLTTRSLRIGRWQINPTCPSTTHPLHPSIAPNHRMTTPRGSPMSSHTNRRSLQLTTRQGHTIQRPTSLHTLWRSSEPPRVPVTRTLKSRTFEVDYDLHGFVSVLVRLYLRFPNACSTDTQLQISNEVLMM